MHAHAVHVIYNAVQHLTCAGEGHLKRAHVL